MTIKTSEIQNYSEHTNKRYIVLRDVWMFMGFESVLPHYEVVEETNIKALANILALGDKCMHVFDNEAVK